MSWYNYLEAKLSFPFRAKCTASKIASLLQNGETVDVLSMGPDEVCTTDMLVIVRWHGRKVAAPLAQITAVAPDESTEQQLATGITG